MYKMCGFKKIILGGGGSWRGLRGYIIMYWYECIFDMNMYWYSFEIIVWY